MIIIRLSGGLGNQLFQYAMARSVADFHRVDLKLDTTAYMRNLAPRAFRLDNFCIRAEVVEGLGIASLKQPRSLVGRGLKKAKLAGNKTLYMEKARGLYDESVFNSPNRYFDGYWQNEKYFLGNRGSIKKDLRLRLSLQPAAQKYAEKISCSNAVAIHVRRGDYLNNPAIGVLDSDYYQKAAKYVHEKTTRPQFFVFSDDIDWCRHNINCIGDLTYVDDTTSEVDDFALMKLCNHNIIANSSFSWWAGWLNNNEDKIIVAPKVWVAKDPGGYNICPSGWITL